MTLRCCVCERDVAIATELWPNAWERTRKRFACCGDTCVAAFDSDLHWVPSRLPTPAPEGETNRMIGVLRTRLHHGDSPSVVTRELLLAGVPPELIRGILFGAQAGGARSRREARRTTAWGILGGFLTGVFRFGVNRDKRDPDTFAPAFADLERWKQRVAEEGTASA